MKYSIKKFSKRKKWIVLILTIALLAITTFYLLDNKGVSYTLPEVTDSPKSTVRPINNYLGKEVSWFLYTPDKVPIRVVEAGEGETIVTLHGGYGLSYDIMRSFMRPFEDRFHIVYYDQRGSARSPVPDNDLEKYITVENMVNDLELLRRELKVEKLRLVAHSMGAILAYEYMSRFPGHVGDVVIVSGHTPKLPETNAEFYDAYTSRNERDAFREKQLKQMIPELEALKQQADTNSAEYTYLKWKMRSAALQVYDIKKWRQAADPVGMYNARINQLIGPEVTIPWTHLWTFYITKRQFDNGTLDTTLQTSYRTPVNFMPVIENHSGRIDYMLGTHEVGDWNLRLYRRTIQETDKIKMHIFENAGHNIWIDQPEAFQMKLAEILMQSDQKHGLPTANQDGPAGKFTSVSNK